MKRLLVLGIALISATSAIALEAPPKPVTLAMLVDQLRGVTPAPDVQEARARRWHGRVRRLPKIPPAPSIMNEEPSEPAPPPAPAPKIEIVSVRVDHPTPPFADQWAFIAREIAPPDLEREIIIREHLTRPHNSPDNSGPWAIVGIVAGFVLAALARIVLGGKIALAWRDLADAFAEWREDRRFQMEAKT